MCGDPAADAQQLDLTFHLFLDSPPRQAVTPPRRHRFQS